MAEAQLRLAHARGQHPRGAVGGCPDCDAEATRIGLAMVGLGVTMNNERAQELDPEQLLAICLDWLRNVSQLQHSTYLAAMPNNVPGVAAMAERLEVIQQQRALAEAGLAERRRARAESKARNADGMVKTDSIRVRKRLGYLGVIRVHAHGRWNRHWTCGHRHPNRETAVACAQTTMDNPRLLARIREGYV